MEPGSGDPLMRQLEANAVRFEVLLRENHLLRVQRDEALARLDAASGYAVYVKPQSMPLADCLKSLPDARAGDIVREAVTAREWVRRGDDGEPRWIERGGMPPDGTVLSTPETRIHGSREMIMAEEDSSDMSVPTENELRLADINTGGAIWEAFVNQYGHFRACHPAYGEVGAWSRDALHTEARKATSIGRVKLDIPYMRLVETGRGWHWVRGTATGIHGGNGNLLINERGKTEQVTGWSHNTYLRPPTEAVQARLLEIAEARSALDKEYKELQQGWVFPGGLKSVAEAEVDRVKREGQAGD